MNPQVPPRRPPPSYFEACERQRARELLKRVDEALAGERPFFSELKPAPLFVVRAQRGHILAGVRAVLQEQLEGVRTVVVLPEGVELVSSETQATPDLLKLPVIDQADLLPSTCSCGRGPVSCSLIGRKDPIRLCVESPAACRPQQN